MYRTILSSYFCRMLHQDSVERNRLAGYWKQLSGVIFGCICLFVFEMCERFEVLLFLFLTYSPGLKSLGIIFRGMQLRNPFYSVWATKTSANVAVSV